MFLIGYFLKALSNLLYIVLTFYLWIIVARAVLSWVNLDPRNPIIRFIHNVTEPVLAPIRRRLPLAYGGIDFSPIVVFLVIIFLNNWLVPSINQFSNIFLR